MIMVNINMIRLGKFISCICICLLLIQHSEAQKINFKVLDVSTGLPVKNVKVSALPKHLFITYSNDHGEFSFTPSRSDTIQLSKDHYHLLLLKVAPYNFDSIHIVTVGMVPDIPPATITDHYANLQDFEFHFIHDVKEKDSKMEIHIMENVEAIRQRNHWNDQSFKVGAVNIDHPHSTADPADGAKPRYRLRKK
jgi:hypothetical protein